MELARPDSFVIRGKRVSLRTTKMSDLADYERWNDPSWKAWETDGPWFRSKADEIGLAGWRRGKLPSQVPPYPFLEIETATGVHIGWVVVYHRDNDPHMTEVGIDIAEDSCWAEVWVPRRSGSG